MAVKFTNVQIITPTGIRTGEVVTEGELIADVSFGKASQMEAEQVIDGNGMYLSPGFIDVHTHGAGNADFMDGTPEAVYQACRKHMEHGTTALVPTTITSTKQSLFDTLEMFNQVELRREDMPEILGLHLEGPYFSYNQRGAQDPQYLRNPDPEEYTKATEISNRIIRWSFAVELEGGRQFLQFLRKKGIVASLAHSDATCGEVMDAYENGIEALTHFYSGMSGVHRKNAFRIGGAVEAGYLLDDLYVEVIADGCHLPAELLQLIYKVKGADRICLVTDSMRGAGMPEGHYVLGNKDTGLDTIVEDGVAKLPDRSAFAGSVATGDRLVRTMYRLTNAPLYEAVKMMSLTPAKLLGIDGRKGSICQGKEADLLLFDEDIQIELVMTRGKIQLRK